MIDIRTGKKVNEKSVRFSDEESPLSYLAQMFDDEGGTVVGIYAGDGDCIGVIDSEETAQYLMQSLQHALDNNFWEE